MLLAEPQKTQWDLNFSVLGFPVRVHPFFWLMCLIMGAAGGKPMTIMMVMLVFFVSILIHELGHALMIRRFGRDAYIVLYGMGGLAIEGSPDPYKFSYNPRGDRRTAQEQIYICLAGPAAQMILAGILLVFAKAMQGNPHIYWAYGIIPTVDVNQSRQITPQLQLLLYIAFQVNIGWALMNLLPVFPLDGGQISMQLFMLRDSYGGMVRAIQLSIGTAIVVALFALVVMKGDLYLVFLFGSLAYSNYMMYTQIHGTGGREW